MIDREDEGRHHSRRIHDGIQPEWRVADAFQNGADLEEDGVRHAERHADEQMSADERMTDAAASRRLQLIMLWGHRRRT